LSQKKQKKIAKLPNGTNNSDPFGGDMEDDIARIAREMEAKYVSICVRNKWKKVYVFVFFFTRFLKVI
jgi:hypothetical protein